MSACALNVSAQTLHTDNLQYKPFGFQKKLVVPAREVSYSRGFIYNDKVYFCAAPQSMERKGFEDRDSTYIYDPKKHTLVSANRLFLKYLRAPVPIQSGERWRQQEKP